MTPRHFAWQAWHLGHWAGSGGTLGPGLVAGDAAALCVAGVALGDIKLRFTWQAWHLATSTFRFTWQAWHLATSTFVLRGRRGTWGTGLALVARLVPGLVAGDAAALCVAGVALGDIQLRFTWQAWHLATSTFRFTWQAWRLATSTFVLRGRRGTWGTGLALVARLVPGLVAGDAAALCVAGVALGDIQLRFTWQAWHLATSTFVLRGSRGLRHWALYSPVTRRHLAWQAWHLDTIFHPTIFHTQLCRRPPSFTTPSFTHNFVTQHLSPHHLSHHIVTHHLSHTTLSHALFHTQLSHTHTRHLSHKTLSYTPSFFVTRHLSHTTLSHTQHCFTSRSSTTSFVFPSFPVPATTFGAHDWKKMPCGVIRSFNSSTAAARFQGPRCRSMTPPTW